MLDVMSRRPARRRHGHRRRAGVLLLPASTRPTPARRFREALDLIVKAWTTPGPFLWNSKHYFFRYVNPWPRPLQQPHPPIWIPGAGSLETIEFVAQRRYAYMGIPYFHIDVFRRVFDQFREACAEGRLHGRAGADGLGRADLRRRDRPAGPRGVRAALLVLRQATCSRTSRLAPPGYTSAQLGPGDPQEPRVLPRRAEDAGTTSRRASSPSSAARRRCGRSWTTTRRSWASAWC